MKRKFLGALLLAALLALAVTACAAQTPATLALDIRVEQEGRSPKPIDYTVRLTADGASTPMPAGQTGGSYDVTINGPGTLTFPAITYDHVGTYTYTIRQLKGDVERCTYDDSEYIVTVYVRNTADFSTFETTVVFHEMDGGPKPNNDLFKNVYTPAPANGNVTPTGVADHWPKFLAGSAALFAVSGVLAMNLRRKEEEPAAETGAFDGEDSDGDA